MKQNAGIYRIFCAANGTHYIRSSATLGDRIAEHRRKLRLGTHENSRMQRTWTKYGEESFAFEVVEIVTDLDRLLEREQTWMDETKPALNLSPTAGSPRGYRHSDDARQRIAAGARARLITDEVRRSYSKSALTRSQEHKLKIGDAFAKEWEFISPEGRLVKIKNLRRFCLEHGLTPENMAKVARGERRQHRGWTRSQAL